MREARFTNDGKKKNQTSSVLWKANNDSISEEAEESQFKMLLRNRLRKRKMSGRREVRMDPGKNFLIDR